jgi:micrococcal nuclease
MYEYRAKVVRVIDGDTIDLRVELGFHISVEDRFRLYGIDTPELNSSDPEVRAKAVLAKNRLIELLPVGLEVRIQTLKDKREKFGRYLAMVFINDTEYVNGILLSEGLAKVYSS